MLSEKVIQDFGHEVTVLYYNNVHKGYKFIGDDPESKIIKVPSDVLERVYNKLEMTGHEEHMPARAYLDKFYYITGVCYLQVVCGCQRQQEYHTC